MLFDAFGWKHHTAIMARIPHDGTFDGESRLHPRDIKGFYLEYALISHQVRVDELTPAKCLQGVRHSASEFNIISLTDSMWPNCRNICREKIGCTAEGQNE